MSMTFLISLLLENGFLKIELSKFIDADVPL